LLKFSCQKVIILNFMIVLGSMNFFVFINVGVSRKYRMSWKLLMKTKMILKE